MGMSQIAILSIIGVLFAVQFKSHHPEYGIYICVAISLFLFAIVLNRLRIFTQSFDTIQNYIQLDSVYLNTILKMIGITYLSEFASSICKDTGYQTLGGQIEVFAKLSILAFSLPIMLALFETIQVFLS